MGALALPILFAYGVFDFGYCLSDGEEDIPWGCYRFCPLFLASAFLDPGAAFRQLAIVRR